jgi:hypothetical protein
VKEGQLDSVLEKLHRSSGELAPANAAGFSAFEEGLSVFSAPQSPSRGRSRAQSLCRHICSTTAAPFWPIRRFFRPSHFISHR